MKRFAGILFIIGILFVIGTAGALEVDNISFLQAFIQGFIGIVMCVVGAALID